MHSTCRRVGQPPSGRSLYSTGPFALKSTSKNGQGEGEQCAAVCAQRVATKTIPSVSVFLISVVCRSVFVHTRYRLVLKCFGYVGIETPQPRADPTLMTNHFCASAKPSDAMSATPGWLGALWSYRQYSPARPRSSRHSIFRH